MKQEVYQDHEPDYIKNNMSYLENWVFHYNNHTSQWAAIPREIYTEYWNNYKNANILKNKHLNILLDNLSNENSTIGKIK